MTDSPSFDQRLFGLRVRSTHPIPFAPPSDGGPPDVRATFGSMPEWLLPSAIGPPPSGAGPAPHRPRRAGGAEVLDYSDQTRILVSPSCSWMPCREPVALDRA